MTTNDDGNRGKGGRFKKGCKGGPGRPKKSAEDKYLDEFRKGVSLAAFRRVTKKVVEMAETGDLKAARLLFEYGIGKPQEYVATPLEEEQRVGPTSLTYVVDPKCLEAIQKREGSDG